MVLGYLIHSSLNCLLQHLRTEWHCYNDERPNGQELPVGTPNTSQPNADSEANVSVRYPANTKTFRFVSFFFLITLIVV